MLKSLIAAATIAIGLATFSLSAGSAQAAPYPHAGMCYHTVKGAKMWHHCHHRPRRHHHWRHHRHHGRMCYHTVNGKRHWHPCRR
jgi:hypothetical protein